MIRSPNTTMYGKIRWNRWRVSNLTAALAAIMLFASTQVSRPADEPASAALGAGPITMDAPSVPDNQEADSDGVRGDSIPAEMPAGRKHRGLKLSLFKFRR